MFTDAIFNASRATPVAPPSFGTTVVKTSKKFNFEALTRAIPAPWLAIERYVALRAHLGLCEGASGSPKRRYPRGTDSPSAVRGYVE
jgi:hypothetical protein